MRNKVYINIIHQHLKVVYGNRKKVNKVFITKLNSNTYVYQVLNIAKT